MSTESPYTIEVIQPPSSTSAADELFRDEWTKLYDRQQGMANPFAHPVWVETWLRHFCAPEDGYFLTARNADGELVGVAPFYRQTIFIKRLKIGQRMLLAGMGLTGSPLEIPGLLLAPGLARPVTRAFVEHLLVSGGADWYELTLNRRESWLENDWLRARQGSYDMHRAARACVVLKLAPTWEQLQQSLKRNVKESMRRSRNRLARDGRDWKAVRRATDLDRDTAVRLLGMHGMRAAEVQSSSEHHDAYGDPAIREFMLEVLPALGKAGGAAIHELYLDDRHIASQLVLLAPNTVYIHSSGFDPAEWNLGPVTFLQADALRDAVRDSREWANFSPGPNVSKLRWSEELFVYDDFLFCTGTRSARWRQAAHGQMVALMQSRRAAQAAGARRSVEK